MLTLTVVVGFSYALLSMYFLSSAFAKIKNGIKSFAASIFNYKLLPNFFILPAAVIILGFELSPAMLFIVPEYILFGLIALTLLNVTFSVAQLSALIRNLKIDCGCHGIKSKQVSFSTVIIPIKCAIVSGCILLAYGMINDEAKAYKVDCLGFGIVLALGWWIIQKSNLLLSSSSAE